MVLTHQEVFNRNQFQNGQKEIEFDVAIVLGESNDLRIGGIILGGLVDRNKQYKATQRGKQCPEADQTKHHSLVLQTVFFPSEFLYSYIISKIFEPPTKKQTLKKSFTVLNNFTFRFLFDPSTKTRRKSHTS